MTDYEIHQKFGDVNVGVIFLFDEYGQNDLIKDYQDILDYQNKKGFSEDRDRKK